MTLNEKSDSENYQTLKKFQTLLGESEKTQPLRKLSDSVKESFFVTLKVLGSGKVKVILCRLLTRLSALGNNAF